MRELLLRAIDLINYTTLLAAGLALLGFMWGLARSIFSENEKDKEAGRSIMKWGLVGLFVMTSVWGLVRFLQQDLEISSNSVFLNGTDVPVSR